MGSSWRYCHVAITPYSLGGFQGIACMFFTSLLVLFHGLAFCFDGQAREFTRRRKTLGLHRSKKKKQIGPNSRPHLFTAFSNPGEPPLYPTRSHLLWDRSKRLKLKQSIKRSIITLKAKYCFQLIKSEKELRNFKNKFCNEY